MGPSEVVILVVAFGLPLFLIVGVAMRSLRPIGDEQADEFALLSGIEATDDSRPLIRRYLASSRRLRLLLVLGAVLLPVVARNVWDGGPAGGYTALLGACLVGTIWAEVRLSRPEGPVRTALLRTRRVGDYLGRPLLWSPSVVGALAAATWAGVTTLAARHPNRVDRATPTEIVIGLVFAAAVPAVVIAAQRWIVSRPQPVVEPGLVAADDAIRAASVRFIAAVGTAMGLLNLSGGAQEFAYSANGLVDFVFGGTAIACLALAWLYWCARKPGRLMPTRRPLRPTPEGV